MKLYITFGTAHNHFVNGKLFGYNCSAEIECTDWHDGRAKAFKAFGDKFCTSYETKPKGMVEPLEEVI